MSMDAETMAPDELRALANRIEAKNCTGISATWCPLHGDCDCPARIDGERTFDAGACPLHGPSSSHGETRRWVAGMRNHLPKGTM